MNLGWSMQYTLDDAVKVLVMDGLGNIHDVVTSTFGSSSDNLTRRALWSGSYQAVTVSSITAFGLEDLYVRTYVSVRNNGLGTLSNYSCKIICV
jgi:hypothetical protein